MLIAIIDAKGHAKPNNIDSLKFSSTPSPTNTPSKKRS